MNSSTTRPTTTRPDRLPLLLAWIFANFLGGFGVGFLEDNGMQFFATLVLTGAIVGSFQWLVLQRAVRQMGWWPLASAIGWIVGSLVMSQSGALYRPIVDFLWQQVGLWEVFWLNVITGPIPVLGMAIAQIFLLSRQAQYSTRFLWQWLLLSGIGGMVRGGVSAALCASWCPALPIALVGLVTAMGWAAYGLITGIAWMRQRPTAPVA